MGYFHMAQVIGDPTSSKSQKLRPPKRSVIETAQESLLRIYNELGIRHLFPIFILIIYSFAGALFFMWSERGEDVERRTAYRTLLISSRNQLIDQIDSVRLSYYAHVRGDPFTTPANITQGFTEANQMLVNYLSTLIYMLSNWHNLKNMNTHLSWKLEESNRPNKSVPSYNAQMLLRNLEELELGYVNKSESWKKSETEQSVMWYEERLGIHRWESQELAKTPWNIWGALLFAGTLYSTIGYGQIAAVSTLGRVLTVIYAVIGIPMFLLILNSIGKVLITLFRKFWRFINSAFENCKTCCHRIFHRIVSIKKFPTEIDKIDSDEVCIVEVQVTVTSQNGADEDHFIPFPVTLAIAVLLGWLLACAGIFCIWETNWSYGTSIYFMFVSLTTIGLGDIVPDHPKYFLAVFMLILIGLALVSMCFSVIQMKIETLFEEMLLEITDTYEVLDIDGAEMTDSTYSNRIRKADPFAYLTTGNQVSMMNAFKALPGLNLGPKKVRRNRAEKARKGGHLPQTASIPAENHMTNKLLYSMMGSNRKRALKTQMMQNRLMCHRGTQTLIAPAEKSTQIESFSPYDDDFASNLCSSCKRRKSSKLFSKSRNYSIISSKSNSFSQGEASDLISEEENNSSLSYHTGTENSLSVELKLHPLLLPYTEENITHMLTSPRGLDLVDTPSQLSLNDGEIIEPPFYDVFTKSSSDEDSVDVHLGDVAQYANNSRYPNRVHLKHSRKVDGDNSDDQTKDEIGSVKKRGQHTSNAQSNKLVQHNRYDQPNKFDQQSNYGQSFKFDQYSTLDHPNKSDQYIIFGQQNKFDQQKKPDLSSEPVENKKRKQKHKKQKTAEESNFHCVNPSSIVQYIYGSDTDSSGNGQTLTDWNVQKEQPKPHGSKIFIPTRINKVRLQVPPPMYSYFEKKTCQNSANANKSAKSKNNDQISSKQNISENVGPKSSYLTEEMHGSNESFMNAANDRESSIIDPDRESENNRINENLSKKLRNNLSNSEINDLISQHQGTKTLDYIDSSDD